MKKTVEANCAVVHVTFGIRFFTYSFILYDSSGYMTCSSSASVVDGNWHHICGIYDDENLKMYFYTDGVLTGTNTCSKSYASSWTNGLFIARDPNSSGDSYWYNGHLNDVRIYDHALSPKEIKELSKAMIMHFPCNESYAEATSNIATSLEPIPNRGGWGKLRVTQNGINDYHFIHSTTDSGSLSYWSTFVYTLPSVYHNKTVSFSARLKNIKINDLHNTSWIAIGQGNDGTYPTHISGMPAWHYNELYENMLVSWTGQLTNSSNYLVVELWNDDINVNGKIEFDIYDIQIELKDHVSAYTENIRSLKYDKTIYTEPDGSKWLRIAHHNNPASGVLFSSSDDFTKGVYKNSDTWFDVYAGVCSLKTYELMVKQKTTSDAAEAKYRWIQTVSPLTATYDDVKPASVTRITTSGYTNSSSVGGVYIMNSSTYMVVTNTSSGNWHGAFGSWSAFQGGIPGVSPTTITTGYMDLYVRIDSVKYENPVIHDTSGYDNHGSITGILTCETGSPRYDRCTKFDGHNCYFLATNPLYNNVQPCTFAFWFKPNSSNAAYNTIISNTSPHGGFWISANTEGSGCWSYNAGTYIHGSSGTLSNGVWYHMAWQYKGNNQYQWYLNGKAITTTISGTAKAPTFTKYLNVGGCQCSDSSTSSNKFDQYGSIADIRIYASALSEPDILELYNTGALFDNCDNMMGYQLSEKYTNMLALEEYGIATKQWLGCLSSYTQAHCKCTLTDDGYRIYRTPDLVYPDAGTVMWGGFIIRNSNSNVLNLQEGHRYMIQFEIKGQTTNGFGDSLGWTNQAGWPGGGLIPSPTNAEWICPITANYQSDEWKTFTYKWTISDTVYKVCTTTYSGYTAGETYLSYRDFKIGFGYASTGSLGTDLYIRNIRMYDITNGEPANIYNTGIVEMTGFVEENGQLRIMNGGNSVSEQLIEL